MGNRYWITGVQLAMLQTMKHQEKTTLINIILEKQYIKRVNTGEEQQHFIKQIKRLENHE